MEVIQPARSMPKPSIGPLLGGTAIATILIVTGIVMAYVVLATPMLGTILPSGRLNIGQMATGILIWAIALVGPAAFVLLGASRLVRILTTLKVRNPPRSTLLRALDLAAGRRRGRPRSDAPRRARRQRRRPRVLRRRGHPRAAAGRDDADPRGPLGAADASAAGCRSRIRWSAPVRDAERVRRWLGHDDADFVVKTYAAVVGRGRSITSGPPIARSLRRTSWRAWISGPAAAAQPDRGPARPGARPRARGSRRGRGLVPHGLIW